MNGFKSITDVWEYLYSIPMFSKVGVKAGNFDLTNITLFCERIEHPQKSFKSIHIAGTNGKGSTCNMLEAVYNEAGYKTGMFTSPHLLRYNERVRISTNEISDDEILSFFQEAEKHLEEIPLSYFEISTVLAFWAFAKHKVDIAIIETGLGGRIDSTNIILPELSIITSIGKDHEQILGDTIEKIAFEKAGIIKSKVPVIVGQLDEISLQVISNQAKKMESELIDSTLLEPIYKQGIIQLRIPNEVYNTHLIEPINAYNLAMVYEAVELLKHTFPVDKTVFKTSLEAFKGVSARFERLQPNSDWFFSGSHNSQAIDAMLEGVEQLGENPKTLILSLMKDKITPEILSKFNVFDSIFYYEQESERAAKHSELEPHLNVLPLDEHSAKNILNELKTELVIFAGSFYFYSTIKRWLSEHITES